MKIDLGIPHPDNHVNAELWFTSLIDVPNMVFDGMTDYHELLGEDVSFTPRIATYSCTECPI